MDKRLEKLIARVEETLIGLSVPDAVEARQQPCILCSCHDVDRGLQRDGAYFSPILEPIAEHCRRRGKQVVNLTHPVTAYRSRRVRGGTVSINRAFLRGLPRERIETIGRGEPRAQAHRLARRTALYRSVLQKLKVERIVSIEPPPELCNAAHELGIVVIEPMHGMNLSPHDTAHKAKLEKREDRLLPDIYLAFDPTTHATLTTRLAARSIRCIAMPHPWHVEVHRPHSPLRADPAELDALLRRFRAAFLVTLTWGYDGEEPAIAGIIPNGIMHPALREAIASSPKDILWLLRLHPVQLKRRRYRAHREYAQDLARSHPNVETALASSLPLPMLLPRTHGHITMISGSAGEAALLGTPSLLLCPTLKPGGVNAGLYSELIEAGAATLGELDARAILAWVAARIEHPPETLRKDWGPEIAQLERRLDELLETRR